MTSSYVPNSGDMVWINFTPQAGHEQAGYRPAVVLSPFEYNKKTGLMICCPMTTQVKGYPFEVAIAGKETGIVLADQVKSLDWQKRGVKYKGKIAHSELERIRSMIKMLVG